MTQAEREARDAREDKAREKKLKEQRFNDKEEDLIETEEERSCENCGFIHKELETKCVYSGLKYKDACCDWQPKKKEK